MRKARYLPAVRRTIEHHHQQHNTTTASNNKNNSTNKHNNNAYDEAYLETATVLRMKQYQQQSKWTVKHSIIGPHL